MNGTSVIHKAFWVIVLYTAIGGILSILVALFSPPPKPMNKAVQATYIENIEKLGGLAESRVNTRIRQLENEMKQEARP